MRLAKFLTSFWLAFVLVFGLTVAAYAQELQPPAATNSLTMFTTYPSQEIGIGESVSLPLKLDVSSTAQTVNLSMQQVPDGWTASFHGGNRIVDSVYVEPGTDASVELRLDQPANAASGTYHFVVLASGQDTKTQLNVDLTIREKLPPRLDFSTDLPDLKGAPGGTFRYSVTLKNEGDEDLNVNLQATAPSSFAVTFTLSGQEVTDLPLAANESKSLSVEAKPLQTLTAGSYPITIQAQGGDTETSLALTAEVTGQASISVSSPDGRLSADANAGKDTPIKITISNSGTASAHDIKVSSTEPSGWSVTLNPNEIPEIPAGQQMDVTATLHPADKAVAGDYVVTFKATSAEGSTKSAEFRITVLTSTLWGFAGIALIAVAVGVVAVAVLRFGRR